MLKLLQEIRGFADVTNRRPRARSAGPALTQMRPPVIQAVLPRRKLSVAMGKEESAYLPHPVRITHLKPEPLPGATVPVP